MSDMVSESCPQRYAFPPIVEVIFEVRIAGEASAAKIKKAADWLGGRYRNTVEEHQVEAKLHFANRSAEFTEKPSIYRLTNEDQTEELALSVSSCAWVRRAPYEGWEPFYDRISSELPNLMKAIAPVRIERLGLRYINRIDVPMIDQIARYEDYLNFRIHTDDMLEPNVGFQWAIKKEYPNERLSANVQSSLVQPEILGTIAFAFDIDVMTEAAVPQTEREILAVLPTMRAIKNAIFEAGITERARKLYAG